MSKRTSTSDFSVLSKDETGALISLGYDCLYCHTNNGKVIHTGANSNIDNDFETDQRCDFCDKDVIVECRY